MLGSFKSEMIFLISNSIYILLCWGWAALSSIQVYIGKGEGTVHFSTSAPADLRDLVDFRTGHFLSKGAHYSNWDKVYELTHPSSYKSCHLWGFIPIYINVRCNTFHNPSKFPNASQMVSLCSWHRQWKQHNYPLTVSDQTISLVVNLTSLQIHTHKLM